VTLGAPQRLSYVVAIMWVVFTVSLASWWLVVGLNLTRQIASGAPVGPPASDLRRMFLWEGAVFIILLIGGGLAMVVAIRREHRRRQALETFFMAFTHDLKTAIASVQLQAEGLLEDFAGQVPRAPLERLAAETVRLQIQLENSLFVAQPDGRLLAERLDAAAAIARLAADWPALEVRTSGQALVRADARGFDTILRNLLQNAVVHGGAQQVDVTISEGDSGRVLIRVADSGRGVPPETAARLGELFTRSAPTSGSGVGLYVCRQLATRMGGALRFPPATSGFMVELELPGAR
jgi:signal transduction histidine kinase